MYPHTFLVYKRMRGVFSGHRRALFSTMNTLHTRYKDIKPIKTGTPEL